MYFPYELHSVPGCDALAKLEELRSTGVAVILGDKTQFERNCDKDYAEYVDWHDKRTVEDLVACARKIDLLKWFHSGIEASAAYCAPDLDWWPVNPTPHRLVVCFFERTGL
jgi:hypothetical protein